MSRNSFTTFAIAGVGAIGKHIARELLTVPGVRVIGFSRSTPKTPIEGLEVRALDYADEKTVTEALRGVDVLVSTLPHEAYHLQPGLARASKAAGVQLFVPSEFGMVTDTEVPPGVLGDKIKTHAYLKSIDLPYVLFFTGMWTDIIFVPFFGYDLANRRVTTAGDGTSPQTYTTEFDAAVYIAYVLTHLDFDRLAWKSFRLEGETISGSDLIQRMEEFLGEKIQIVRQDIDELNAKVDREGVLNTFPEHLRVLWAQGYGSVGKNDNALVPGWKPLTVAEALNKFYTK